jgi:hypothetical protein
LTRKEKSGMSAHFFCPGSVYPLPSRRRGAVGELSDRWPAIVKSVIDHEDRDAPLDSSALTSTGES